MVKYSKEQEERNKAFLSSVRKGVSNEKIFKKKPKVSMDAVQKNIPVRYSNDAVQRQNAFKASLNSGSKVSQYLSQRAKEVENGIKPDIDPVIMTRTDYDEMESQTQIQKVAFDLCLKIAGNSIQANKLFSLVRPYLREFIKLSPQLLTYAEKLSRRSAEDINNYFKKILLKDGVYFTPEISFNAFNDRPVNFERITTKPDVIEQQRKQKDEDSRLLERQKQEMQDMANEDRYSKYMRYDENKTKFNDTLGAKLLDKRKEVESANMGKDNFEELEKRNLNLLERMNDIYVDDKNDEYKNKLNYKDVVNDLNERNKKVLETLNDATGDESKDENVFETYEMQNILPKTTKQLMKDTRPDMNKKYLELQKQYPDILTADVSTLKTKKDVADEMTKVLNKPINDINSINETPEKPQKAKEAPVMNTKPNENFSTPARRDDYEIDLSKYSTSKLKNKNNEDLMNDVRKIYNSNDID
jgi:hypothetical protein